MGRLVRSVERWLRAQALVRSVGASVEGAGAGRNRSQVGEGALGRRWESAAGAGFGRFWRRASENRPHIVEIGHSAKFAPFWPAVPDSGRIPDPIQHGREKSLSPGPFSACRPAFGPHTGPNVGRNPRNRRNLAPAETIPAGTSPPYLTAVASSAGTLIPVPTERTGAEPAPQRSGQTPQTLPKNGPRPQTTNEGRGPPDPAPPHWSDVERVPTGCPRRLGRPVPERRSARARSCRG